MEEALERIGRELIIHEKEKEEKINARKVRKRNQDDPEEQPGGLMDPEY